MTTSYQQKPKLAKLVFHFCAGGIPDRLVTDYCDQAQFALADNFSIVEGFDIVFRPDYTKSAFPTEEEAADAACRFDNGLKVDLKAYSNKSAQCLDLTAEVANVIVTMYDALVAEKKVVDSWLPGFDFAEDQVALRWIAAEAVKCDAAQLAWLDEQVDAYSPNSFDYSIPMRAAIARAARAELFDTQNLRPDAPATTAFLNGIASHYVAPTARTTEAVTRLARHTCPSLIGRPIRWVAQQLYELLYQPGTNLDTDRLLLETVKRTDEVPHKLREWFDGQAEVHAPHCAHAHWATPRMIAEAILKRWQRIENRLTRCYTQHERTDPIPT